MLLIVGLGNHGLEYINTRHNVGFMLVDYLANIFKLNWNHEKKFKADIIKHNTSNSKLLLCKPYTYMNNSGVAVYEVMSYYKMLINQLLVIHDDADLELGKIKLKLGGGSAGHNGLKSIDKIMGNNYFRVRIGIGRPTNNSYDIGDYVLSCFSGDEKITVNHQLKTICDRLNTHLSTNPSDFTGIL